MKIPQRKVHKPSGNDRCRYRNKEYWFGKHGSEESDRRYKAWVAELLAGNPEPPTDLGSVTVDELAFRFLNYAKRKYSYGEYTNIKQALRVTLKLHGDTACNRFGPRALIEVRQRMIEADWPRNRINEQVGRVRRMFRWGVSQEMVRVHVSLALRELLPLRRGEVPGLRESEPVRPAKPEQVAAVLTELTPMLADMVRLHSLTGMRPGELFIMRPVDIDQTDAIWVYRPHQHKNKHRGQPLAYALGPQAQALLRPYLRIGINAYLFQPALTVAQRRAQRAAARTSKRTPSQVKKMATAARTHRKYRDHYTTDTFLQALRRAFRRLAGDDKAKLAALYFSPNQLRHTKATAVRAEHGIEAARIALGHRSITTTQIYAEADLGKAKEIARQCG